MCSNSANNRRHHLSYYVVNINGVNVDRRRVTDPAVKYRDMPKQLAVAGRAKRATLPVPERRPIAIIPARAGPSAEARANRTFDPVPTFDPRATLKANLANQSRLNVDAKRADRLLRRQHQKQIRKLRSFRQAKQAEQLTVNLPVLARSDSQGLAAAYLLRPQDAPKKVFSFQGLQSHCSWFGPNPRAHEMVKQNAYKNSVFATTIDLRDDPQRSPNGNTIRRGAIYDSAEAADNARFVSVQIYVEIFSNRLRAQERLRWILEACPNLQRLDVEIIGSDSLSLARQTVEAFKQHCAEVYSEQTCDKITFTASRYDEAE